MSDKEEDRKPNFDYREQLKIDKYALDEECMDQPVRYEQWAQEYTYAKLQLKLAEKALRIQQSAIRRAVTANPVDYGLTKSSITEGVMKAIWDADEECLRLENELIDKENIAHQLKKAEKSFEQRKWMLSEMVKLWLGMYWGDPKYPKGSRAMAEERAEAGMQEYLRTQLLQSERVKLLRKNRFDNPDEDH